VEIEHALPTKLVKIRATSRQDIDLLAPWFKHGCCKWSPQNQGGWDVQTVLQYQQLMQQPDWEYQCMTIEDEGQIVGYLDYRYRKHLGEILGVYLDAHLRGQRVGLHLLRWIIADLRRHHCHQVFVTIDTKNTIAIDRCLALGFKYREKRNDMHEDRSTASLQYDIPSLLYLSLLKKAYTLLQGENLYLHHAALALALTHSLQELPGVQAILGLGSLTRNFADAWSDLDLAVLGSGPDLAQLWRGERNLAGIDVDLFVVDLESSPPHTWDDSRLQAFEESVVLFARDSGIIQLLQQAVRFDEKEQVMKIQEMVLKLGWIGFQPRAWYDLHKYGYLWSVPYDLWMRRGSTASAHATVDSALDLTVQLLFLTNRQRIPDVKWRRFLVPHLPWLPPHFASLLEQVDTGIRNADGFQSRAAAVLTIVEGVVSYLEEMGKINGDLYQSYLRAARDYS
jgi:RimJ/RimL family protein N-acetyltransferase/predicted nucleotidyltransferase